MNIKNIKFYLYGCNSRSQIVSKRLEDSGANIVSFIDRDKQGFNIVKPQELELLQCKDNVCIYICMQNAMQHEIVADILYKMGFHYIIFLPVSCKYNMQAYKMVKLWNQIYETGINFTEDIPRYEDFIHADLISENNILYAPMELIFTEVNKNDKWGDKHISLYERNNELYRYIYEGGVLPQAYLQINNELFGKEVQSTLRDRIILYESLSIRINNDSLYYRNMICPVVFSESGHFNLEDGHHRANLAFHLGKEFLPVRISSGEVNYQWLNDFMHCRNYKLFLLLSDIVLWASNFKSCSVFSVDNNFIMNKYLKLLSSNKTDIFVTDDMHHMKQADLQIIFRRRPDGVIGDIYVHGISKDLSHMKPCYVLDNCIYYVHISGGDINDFT